MKRSAERQHDLFHDASPPTAMPRAASVDAPATPRTARRATDIEARLQRGHRVAVSVRPHRNRASMLSVTFPPGAVRVRLHEAFLAAPEAVLDALDRYLRTRDRAAWRQLARFARGIPVRPAPAPRAPCMVSRGVHHDLAAIRDEVNLTFFQGRVACGITWGQHGQRRGRRRRSIRYGSYDREVNLVRIHPALDSATVPHVFVRYIVFHEMLHAVVPPEIRGGRTFHHPPAFRRAERTYPDFPAMKKLAATLLQKL